MKRHLQALRRRRPQRRFEALEARALLAADVFISEFLASNDTVLTDTDRDSSDWIELFNAGDETADLTGWYLTDRADDLTKWQFPHGTLEPNSSLVVFASGKDYGLEEPELHTNFSLSRGGEYLGLVAPDGQSIVSQVAPAYPEQFRDISYGVRMGVTDVALVDANSAAQLLVPTDDRYENQWQSQDFVPGDDWIVEVGGEQLTASMGFGSEFEGGFSVDVATSMQGVNATGYVRIPFQVDDPDAVEQLTLNLLYDDGVVFFLNGDLVDLRNASFFVGHDSAAQSDRSDVDALVPETIDVSAFKSSLVAGENVLAIHWLNASVDDANALLSAELLASIESIDRSEYGFFQTPTPGDRNNGVFKIGPIISETVHSPPSPLVSEPMTVTARVEATLLPVAAVGLTYRVMYNDEIEIAMTDDGQGADAVAGDGVYSAQIPANIAAPGEMIRYSVSATDEAGTELQSPRVTDSSGTDQSAEYYGTITQDPELSSDLPIFHWFAERTSRARTRAGTRVSVYYAGEFYDNVFARQRGGATNGSSQKFNFNDDQPFFVNDELGYVIEFNMNAQGSDSTYIRQTMAYQTYTLAGNESSASFHMLMRDNATSDRVGVFIEQVDEVYLERQGLDPDGALYKFVQRSNLDPVFADIVTGIEKKTREDENFDDIAEVVEGLNRATQEERGYSVFDNFNLAQVMNYLAVRSITLDADDVRKNFYLYRDTNGTGQWSVLPWDKDWTFGIRGDGGQFLDHPFFGDEAHRKDNALQWNRLYDAVFNDPVLSEMYLRRLRTVMDELLQAPGTENGILEQLAQSIADQIGGEVGSANPNSIFSFLRDRRDTLFNEHVVDPLAGDIEVIVPEFVSAQYFVPSDNDLGQSWTSVGEPANIAAWTTGETGIGFGSRFTELIRSEVNAAEMCETCTSVYVRVPFTLDDASAISRMTLQMKYDDGFIAYINGVEVARDNVTGDVSFDMDSSSHSNRAAVEFQNFNVSDFVGTLQDGENMLAIQIVNSSPTSNDLLVSPQLLDGIVANPNAAGIPLAQTGNPAIQFGEIEHNPSVNQDQEFVEIRNENDVAVDISGWRIEGGINHVFPEGTVIPSGRSLYVSPSVPGFKSRTEGPSGGQGLFVQGNYEGHLSNFGETIRLIARDETVMDAFTTPVTPSLVQQHLEVSELYYNPPGDDELTEFIELTNSSSTHTLDLTGVALSSGPDVPYLLPDGTMLQPGASLVIAKDREALLAEFPSLTAEQVFGGFSGNFSNGGEQVKVDDANGSTVFDFEYDDADPWPTGADGGGSSLSRTSFLLSEDDVAGWEAATPTPGFTGDPPNNDLNGDGQIDPGDIDFLCGQIGMPDLAFDLDGNGTVDLADVTLFVERRLGSTFGDANLDRVFDSRDLVAVFQPGTFEDNVAGNSDWASGDWNCDGEFTTSDLVRAFQAGHYVAAAAAAQVSGLERDGSSALVGAAIERLVGWPRVGAGRDTKVRLRLAALVSTGDNKAGVDMRRDGWDPLFDTVTHDVSRFMSAPKSDVEIATVIDELIADLAIEPQANVDRFANRS